MSFPKYLAYKDSGVEWLGEVPEHWNVSPLKFSASCNDTVLPESTDEEYEIEYVEISDVDEIAGVRRSSRYKFSSAPSRARRILRDGDVLVSTVRTYLRAISPVVKPPANLIASTGFAVIRPRKDVLTGSFLGYLVRAEWWISEVIARSAGVSYPSINASDLIALPIARPSLSEQTQIARFLDHETARIDALIEEQQRLIELLKEKRQAVISHAVTKGLDPTVPMKDSGVEWLGEVPADWNVLAIKWRTRIRSGDGISPNLIENERQNDKPYPVIGGNGVMGFTSCHNVTSPLIVIGRVGALCGNVHKVYDSAWVSDNALVLDIDTRSFNMSYLAHLLSARDLNAIADKSAQPLITGSKVTSQYVPCPAIQEQLAIAEFLRSALEKFDRLRCEGEKGIDLLQERRSALISAAVTGKIDVRGWQPPVSAASPELETEAV